MDSDRKYKQNGYQESSRDHSQNGFGRPGPEDRARPPQGPRPSIDITGPRLPRMVQAVAASRCYNCSTMLMPSADLASTCPKCHAALHCCKQCSYFEPSTRFQCLKPVPVRISPKDTVNACELFKPRVTVARDGVAAPQAPPPVQQMAEPRNPSDARAAFDTLFKKSE
jgi:hypothetical protein